jgi:sugar phosphate isomerase/epimerase
MLSLAKRLGYDGIEPRISAEHAHGLEFDTAEAARRDAAKEAEDAGVALCCIATSCSYADAAKSERNVEDTVRAIDLAHDVGCPRIRVFGGRLPDGVSREEAVDRVSQALASVAGHAADAGVVVCMETHDSWCDPADVAEVMGRVNHAAIAVNWDIMHPVRTAGSTMDQAFETLRPWIRHVHFHDGTLPPSELTLCPIGDGGIDHKTAVRLLLHAEYSDYLSGEWINWEPCEIHLPRELATMKGYEGTTG